MYFSLSSSYPGKACAIKKSIEKYSTNVCHKTQFFDWLVCSMKSINEILQGKPILFEENYIYPNSLNVTSINFLNFHLLTSHHDIHEFNENSINYITDKYNRRYQRLINNIKCETKINFIRYCKNNEDLEHEEINKFFELINSFNNQLQFKFILISDYENLTIPDLLLDKPNFIFIDLNKYIDEEVINETDEYFQMIKLYKCVFNLVK